MSVFPSQVNFVTGDILTATAVNEIGQAINLLDGAQFAAGKNKIINGDFGINQRAFTSVFADGTYGFDRWVLGNVNVNTVYSAQTFTAGAAPVAGYEGTNYARILTTGQTLASDRTTLSQRIEDVRTSAGQTLTWSFWAKAASGTPKIAAEVQQNFGSGGSASVNTLAGQVTLSTSWARYTVTVAVPSISGKTIGTGSFLGAIHWVSAGTDFNSRTGSLGIQNNTFDIWGVQVEAAQTASPFQTATGTKQGELAACQRYYQKSYAQTTAPGTASTSAGSNLYVTISATAITNRSSVRLPVTMRTAPTVAIYSTNSGTAAKIYVESTAADVDGVVQNIGEQGFAYYLNSGTLALGYVTLIQYTVSAEL
jgi:hypothetical protein